MQEDNEDSVALYMEQVRQAQAVYAELGWSTIPLRLNDKRAAVEWADYQKAPPTEEEWQDWLTNGVPDGKGGLTQVFGIGLVTGAVSGVVVVDCDNIEALRYAINEGNVWSNVGVKTTRGQHIYLKHPGTQTPNKVGGQGRDWPNVVGLDLRGDGGIVVLPPSVKFDADGNHVHTYRWTQPDWFDDPELPSVAWSGFRSSESSLLPPSGEWTFDNLRLDSVRSYGERVWDEAAARTHKMGRKMRDGEGRNAWLIRYAGDCVTNGMSEEQVAEACNQFSVEFFEDALPSAEVASVIRSAFECDRRNHPEKYVAQEKYDNASPQRKARAEAIHLITPKSLANLKRLSAGQRFLIDPYVPPQSIIQVVGYNGHGKSLWLLNTLWAAANGSGIGGASVSAPLRTLYMDFESSPNTLNERIEDCLHGLGDMSESLAVWLSSAADEDISFNEGDGLSKFGRLLDEVNPQLVVIDTVRSAWSGMEENSPHQWVKVNNLATAIRNTGRSVIIVHHRNKPSQGGMGSAAGSTAQLKDLDLQIFVTKVVEDEEQARREAALSDHATQVIDFEGKSRTAYSYLRASLPKGYTLNVVFEISFGKMRQPTENHQPVFVGLAKNMTTGKTLVLSSKTPRQKAELLTQHKQMSPIEIATAMQIPLPTIQRWLAEGAKR